ncbi:hypothetical protein ACFSTC_03430 [Nonomuraea ferruginea]
MRAWSGIRLRPSKLRETPVRGLVVRFVFGAFVSVVAGVVGHVWGGRWQGACSWPFPPSWAPR